jgi:hypothetical protein
VPLEEAARSQSRDDQGFFEKSKDGPGSELPAPSKEMKKRGAATKEEAEDVLSAVVKTRAIPEGERLAYLRSVSALGAEKALEHIRAVFPEEERKLAAERREGDPPPVLATIQLEDKEEANLVSGILAVAPRSDNGAAALSIAQEEKNQVTTEVEALPADLARLARWLQLLDTTPATASKARVAVLGGTKADEAAPKTRVAVVRLRFGKPPAARAEPKGK